MTEYRERLPGKTARKDCQDKMSGQNTRTECQDKIPGRNARTKCQDGTATTQIIIILVQNMIMENTTNSNQASQNTKNRKILRAQQKRLLK